MLLRLFWVLCIYLFASPLSRAQVIVTEMPPETKALQLVKQFFTGDGIKLIEVSYKGQREAFGSFTDSMNEVGFNKGLVMSTGRVETIAGKNSRKNAGSNFGQHFFFDEDLITKASQCDGAVLTIDFIPQYDSLSFAFIFGSEEYPEFVNKEFNDMFQLLLQPLFIKAKNKNIALLPDKKMVSINNINQSKNTNWYIDNTSPESPFYQSIEWDGFTRPLYAGIRVAAGKPYRLKIMLVDLEDCEYDSGVLLEAYSLRSLSSKPKTYAPINRTCRFNFPVDKWELPPTDLKKLKQLCDSLSRFTFDSIVIIGHTDKSGSPDNNVLLSAQRANYIANQIKNQGVRSSHFIARGKGSTDPIHKEETAEAMALNRRVELIFYRKAK